jgi:nicotinate-nucleotide adenylyltransferase
MAIIVFCPMKIERTAVQRALRAAGLHHARVVQTGIGKDAIVKELRRVAAGHEPGSLMILAGACGGLTQTDDVPRIAAVVDEHGGRWTPRFADAAGVMLIAVDRIVAGPEDKRELAASSGAAIVDMETHAFAAECERRGLAWTVVRGVSDTPEETLPAEVLGWVTPSGGTHVGRAVWDMLRKPSLIPHIFGVVRRANRVLPKVGRRVVEISRQWIATDSKLGSGGQPSDVASISPLPVPAGVPLVIFFGGTFDPPHLAHVELARRVRDQLELLHGCPGRAWLVFVPAARSPHKADGPVASDEARLELVRIATNGVERAAVWDDEIARSGSSQGPSYTVETLARARGWMNDHGGSQTVARLLIGADQATSFHRWREPRRIISLAEPAVMARGETGADAASISQRMAETGFWSTEELAAWALRIVPVGRIDASASEVRRAFAEGRSADAEGLLAPGVSDAIRRLGLYGAVRGADA